MNSVLQEILKTRVVTSPTGICTELNSEISADMGHALQDAITRIDAVRTLEVGLCYGISSLFICEAIAGKPDAKHFVMDPNQSKSYGSIGLHNIERAGYSRFVEFYEASSHSVLPQLEMAGTAIDFAFIDGSHLFDYTLLEFFYIDRILRVGGLMAFDDLQMPAVRKVCRFMLTNRKYKLVQALPSTSAALSVARSALKFAAAKFPKLAKVLKPEIQHPDADFGIPYATRLAIFEKLDHDSDQTRNWDYYRDF